MQKLARLKVEMGMLTKNPPPGIHCWQDDENSEIIQVEMIGPVGSPYEKGTFRVEVTLGDRYPFAPPSVQFLTQIYHPNIDPNGRVCLTALKPKPSGSWSVMMNIPTILGAIRVLLAEPNLSDALMSDIAKEYLANYDSYKAKAEEATLKHAVRCGRRSSTPAPADETPSTSSSTNPGPDPKMDEDEEGNQNQDNDEDDVESAGSAPQPDSDDDIAVAAEKDEREKIAENNTHFWNKEIEENHEVIDLNIDTDVDENEIMVSEDEFENDNEKIPHSEERSECEVIQVTDDEDDDNKKNSEIVHPIAANEEDAPTQSSDDDFKYDDDDDEAISHFSFSPSPSPPPPPVKRAKLQLGKTKKEKSQSKLSSASRRNNSDSEEDFELK